VTTDGKSSLLAEVAAPEQHFFIGLRALHVRTSGNNYVGLEIASEG